MNDKYVDTEGQSQYEGNMILGASEPAYKLLVWVMTGSQWERIVV